MFFLYNLLLALASVILLPYYWFRGRRQGADRSVFRQRLGWLDRPIRQTAPGSVWLHAVSVGEILSCEELVAGLRARFPAVKILVSTTTVTGQRMAREKLASPADGIFYAPLDLRSAVRRTLEQVRPRLVIVAETEIWPNLFREIKRAGAGLLLVNARLSDLSAPRYRRFRFFFRHVLRLADSILAQSPLDRQRLLEAGAPPEKVEVGGNLKFDFRVAQAKAPAEVVSLLERTRPDSVILAGSTREGEEALVVTAFRQLAEQHEKLLLILAPRHPDRFDAVAQVLSQAGYPFVRRSRLTAGDVLNLPGILLLDSLGELASLYPLAKVVFVGGSLVEWGGHNILEPAFAGRPVVVGPHMQNFRAIADALLAAGGLVQINGAAELAPALSRLLDHPQEAAAIGEKARCLAESHRGATERAVDRAEQLYDQAVPNRPPRPFERVLLWFPARLWEAVARLRVRAYQRGWLLRRRLGACTVSVGNLTVGGTGKTPVVLWLIEQLQSRGLSCALLTRGYGRLSPAQTTILDPGAEASPLCTGDEAQLTLRRCRIPVGIARNRHRAGTEIKRRFHPDVIILDDGFQHQQLARDLDLVLVDVTAPFGGRELLPLGRLREPLSSLSRADVLLLTRCQPWERWEGMQQELRRYNERAPIFLARSEPVAFMDAGTGQEKPLLTMPTRPVLAFCGVANPDAFWQALERIGVRVVETMRFRDHHHYSGADVRRLLAAARQCHAEALVTTEKDVINLWHAGDRSFSPGRSLDSVAAALVAPLDLYWLKTRLVIDRGDEMLELIERKLSRPAQLKQ